MSDQTYSVAELAARTGLTCRRIQQAAPSIPGHFIKGARTNRFRVCRDLEDWIEDNKKRSHIEPGDAPPRMVGGEVLDYASSFHDKLQAHLRRAILTQNEKAQLQRWLHKIAKLRPRR